MSPKKVLVLNYEFPPIGGGGGRVSENLARLLSKKYQIHVITAHFKGSKTFEKKDGYTIQRIRCLRTHVDRCYIWQMFTFVLFSFIPIFLFCLRHRPHLIHCHFAVPTGPLAYLMKVFFRIPYIVTIHGGDVPSFLPEQTHGVFKWIKSLTVPIWNNANRIVAVSHGFEEMAKQDYPGISIQTICNGVDTGFFTENKNYSPDPSSTKFLFVGRFSRQKNVPYMITALAQLPKDLSWSLDLVGDGPELSLIQGEVKKQGLESRIKCHGWKDREFVKNMMQTRDIFLMPSLKETLPLVGPEAMSCGMSFVGHDNAGLEDFIANDVNGVLCPNNTTSYCDAIVQSIKNRNRYRIKSLEKSKDFDWFAVSTRYERVYEDIIGSASGV